MTIHFNDVSAYQGDYWPGGAIIAKASEGSSWTDARFVTTRARTLAGGWPFLPYHFLRVGDVPGQVAHAIAVIGRGRDVMLDIETGIDNTDPTLAEAEQFVDLYGQQSGGGTVTLVYIPHWYWQNVWHSPSLLPLTARGPGLISSYYVPYSDTGPGWNAYGGVTPIIWQWTSTPLDTNAYKGTEDQLAAVFAGSPVAPTAPKGSEMFILHMPATINPDGVEAWWLYDQYGRVDQKPNAGDLRSVYFRGGVQTVELTAADLPNGWTWARFFAEFESQGAKRYPPAPDPGPAPIPGEDLVADLVVSLTGTLSGRAVGAVGPAQPLDPNP
jgi:microcystin-dependent protein